MCNQKRRGKCRFGGGGLPFLQQQTIYCPCETGSQTPEHVLQFCPLHREERTQHWPKEPSLQKSSGARKWQNKTYHDDFQLSWTYEDNPVKPKKKEISC